MKGRHALRLKSYIEYSTDSRSRKFRIFFYICKPRVEKKYKSLHHVLLLLSLLLVVVEILIISSSNTTTNNNNSKVYFSNTAIHHTDVLLHNILIMLEKSSLPKTVHPCTQMRKTDYTIFQ